MIYEVRTYTLKPGSVPQFEENFANALPFREKFSKLGAFWHTEIGPLNQVIHVWPYESVEERNSIRAEASKDPHWPPHNPPDMYVSQESEIFIPAPFMRPLGGDQALGNIYEMRIYTYRTGTMSKVVQLWADAVPHREKFSPLAAGMYTEIGGLNKWIHIWPYKDLEERNKVRAEASASPHWPPATREFLVKQENKILVPASFSPMH
tara:strand:- start:990 stop:1610 length:621 start_codon:yes stop_codon:yes gene_type:complete